MKRICLLLLAAFLAGHQALAAIRSMGPEDPNLDPGWDWSINNLYTLYSSASGGAVESHEARLPFHTPGNTLSGAQDLDLHPEDGWVLAHRDFGTPRAAQPFPFFALYNKYRGTFRIMLFNAMNREGSCFLGELAFLDGARFPSARAALFTFADPDLAHGQTYLDHYDPRMTLTAFSNMTAYGAWAVFDFPLVGFDPGLKDKDPILVFRVTAIDKQTLTLKGAGEIQLFQLIESQEARPAQAGPADQALAAARRGATTYKTVGAFIQNEILSEAGQQRHQHETWYRAARAVAQSALGGYLPMLGAMGAVVESFVGGANRASEWEPLKFTGQFQFSTEGALQTRRELWAHHFFLNPGPLDDLRAQRPLRRVDWGIFNFLGPAAVRRTAIPWRFGDWSGSRENVRLVQPPELKVNPDSGLALASLRVAFIETGGAGDAAEDPARAASSGFMDLATAMATGYSYDKQADTRKLGALLWELRFRTGAPTRNADGDIVILKRTGFNLEP